MASTAKVAQNMYLLQWEMGIPPVSELSNDQLSTQMKCDICRNVGFLYKAENQIKCFTARDLPVILLFFSVVRN